MPEWRQRGYEVAIYEVADTVGTWQGDSLDLAYFLAEVRCVRPLLLEACHEAGDVWCTGTLGYVNDKPCLHNVEPGRFHHKLQGFLDQMRDCIFFVPAVNVSREEQHCCEEHQVPVLSLANFRETLPDVLEKKAWARKIVVTIDGPELPLLVETLFTLPHFAPGRLAPQAAR